MIVNKMEPMKNNNKRQFKEIENRVLINPILYITEHYSRQKIKYTPNKQSKALSGNLNWQPIDN